MKHNFRILSVALAACAITACSAQSDVQARYVKTQKLCRAEAEANVPLAAATGDAAAANDVSGALARQFSECMNRGGWKVAAPKPPGGGTSVAQNPSTGVLPSAPPALSAVAASPAASASSPRPAPVALPPVGAPAQQQAPATYQPGRPAGAEGDSYGNGAGRQF